MTKSQELLYAFQELLKSINRLPEEMEDEMEEAGIFSAVNKVKEAAKAFTKEEKKKETALLYLKVTFDGNHTDAESLASAADLLFEMAFAQNPGILEDYGDVEFNKFEVASEI